MPKDPNTISDDYLLQNFDALSRSIQILPRQVALLLGVSKYQLLAYRMEGKSPRFIKEGSSIRYRVGDVRDYMSSHKAYKNTAEVFIDNVKKKQDKFFS